MHFLFLNIKMHNSCLQKISPLQSLCGGELRIKHIYTGWIINVISTNVKIKKLIRRGENQSII